MFEVIAFVVWMRLSIRYCSLCGFIQSSVKFGFERREEKERNALQVASPWVFEIIAFTVWMRVLIR